MLSKARIEAFESVRRSITTWAEREDAITAVLLVGSWARNGATMASDIDVVILGATDRFIAEEDWIAEVLGPDTHLVRTADWGALTERRVQLASGCDVEFGFVPPSWASTDPVDAGTRRVVTDGCQIWHDPTGLLSQLLAAAAG